MPICDILLVFGKGQKADFHLSLGSVSVTLDGEIYNSQEISDHLGEKRDADDEELIAMLYKKHGEEFIYRINGKFSIVLFDSSVNKLIVFRDRCGENILYYYDQPDRLIFATQIKDIVKIAGRLNYRAPTAITDTIYQGVKILAPGHRFVYYPNNGKRDVEKYWTPFTGVKEENIGTVRERLRYLLFDAAKIRYQKSNTAVLCGGFDTSVLCGILKPGVVFSCFNDWDPLQSDVGYSKATAKLINAEQVWARPTKDVFAEKFKAIVLECGIPINGTGQIIHFMLAQKIKKYDKEIDAVIQGAGGDELFGTLRSAIIGWELQLYDNEHFKHYDVLLDRYYGDHVKRFMKLFRINEDWFGEYQGAGRRDVLSLVSVISLLSVLQHELLMANTMFRQFGISTRNPFLDYRVVELALSYPKSWDVCDGEVKRMLKQTFADLLAPEVLQRKHKVGHSVPAHEWLYEYGRKYDTHEYMRRCTDILKDSFCR
ncbi:asparagine synthase-related protein [Candidatus Omnitrophota bacterium]